MNPSGYAGTGGERAWDSTSDRDQEGGFNFPARVLGQRDPGLAANQGLLTSVIAFALCGYWPYSTSYLIYPP